MIYIFLFFYGIALQIFYGFIKISAWIGNPKAKKFVTGRKHTAIILQNWHKQNTHNLPNSKPNIWVHCASLGEFEQGRPLIEKISEQYKNYNIILTFFSPSGYEVRKNYTTAAHVLYLPIDSPSNATFFIKTVNPQFAIFVKYEYWFFYIQKMYMYKKPIIFISTLFREKQFKSIYTYFFKYILKKITYIFVQNEASKQLLQKHNLTHTAIAPDTRFDRVYDNSLNPKPLPIIQAFKKNAKLLVAGSTWLPDEDIITAYIIQNKTTNLRYVIAPHEIKETQIVQLQKKLNEAGVKVLRYSKVESGEQIIDNEYFVLIIDNIGILSLAYKYANIAYIGGGFGRGIHNVLEAAVFGIPIIFGKKYAKFNEANELVAQKGAFSINNLNDFEQIMDTLLHNNTLYKTACEVNYNYVQKNRGGTSLILNFLKQKNYL